MVIAFPRRIVRPITRIMRLIQQIQAGDLTLSVGHRARDEIGELADLLNRMMREFHTFDALKTRKIAEQQQRLQVLADRLGGVLIVDPESGRVSVVSLDMQRMFDWRDLAGHALSEADMDGRLWRIVKESMYGGQSDAERLLEIRPRRMEPCWIQLVIQLVKNQEGITGILLFVSREDH